MPEHYGRTANGQLIGPYATAFERNTEVDAANNESGYTYCACRDCGDVAISTHIHTPELCLLCKDAGCEANNGDCERDDAYGLDAYDIPGESPDPNEMNP